MQRPVVATAVLAVLLAGCGKEPPPQIVPAAGVVLLDGQPLNKVQVLFYPMIEYGAEYVARGVTDEKGRFELSCKGQAGASACENRVVIKEAELPKRLKGESHKVQQELFEYLQALGPRAPEKYASAGFTPLRVVVRPGQKDYILDLHP